MIFYIPSKAGQAAWLYFFRFFEAICPLFSISWSKTLSLSCNFFCMILLINGFYVERPSRRRKSFKWLSSKSARSDEIFERKLVDLFFISLPTFSSPLSESKKTQYTNRGTGPLGSCRMYYAFKKGLKQYWELTRWSNNLGKVWAFKHLLGRRPL